MNRPHAAISSSKLHHDLTRLVVAAVIDDDDLEIACEFGEHRQRIADDKLDICLFVVRGENERQATGDASDRWRRSAGGFHPLAVSSDGGTHSSAGAAPSASQVWSETGASAAAAMSSCPGTQSFESMPAGGSGGNLKLG